MAPGDLHAHTTQREYTYSSNIRKVSSEFLCQRHIPFSAMMTDPIYNYTETQVSKRAYSNSEIFRCKQAPTEWKTDKKGAKETHNAECTAEPTEECEFFLKEERG